MAMDKTGFSTCQKKVDFTAVQETSAQQALKSAFDINQYSVSCVQPLESYVQEQVNNKTYDLYANLHTLKLYQFYPETSNISVIHTILVKALMNLPELDFSTCLYLVPEHALQDDSIVSLVTAHEHLLRANFKTFWSIDLSKSEKVPGFLDCIRSFIAHLICITHVSIEVPFVKEALHMDESTLNAFGKQQGWTIEGNTITIPTNQENQMRSKKFQENIEFPQVMEIINVLSN